MIRYTRKEEIWNAASHGGGILLGVVFGIIFLVWCFRSDNNWAQVGVILYLFGMLGSYIASTLYHSMKHLKEHSNLETLCFIGMGLSVLVAFKPLIASVPAAAFIWIVAEGVSYITGAVFYTLNKTKYMHSVFHFFVLAGSVCHIIAVWDVLMAYLNS